MQTVAEGLTRPAWPLVYGGFSEGIRPEPDLTVSEWAAEYRILPKSSSAAHGKWRNERTPYGREIMDELSPSSSVAEVIFMKATQLGGTEFGNNWIGFVIHLAPGPLMFIRPTSASAKRESKTRLAPTIDSTPVLRARIANSRSRDSGNTTLMKEFPGGVLIFAGANSAADLKSQPCRFVMFDELDEYPDDVDGQGDPEELGEKRTDTYTSRKKLYKVSTPTHEDGRIAKAFARSDQRYYFLHCPHCAHEQRLVWEGMHWETRKRWTIERSDDGEVVEVPADTEGAREEDTEEISAVWYECASCHGRIEERHKTEMLDGGRWIAMRPGRDRPAGFQLSALYSPIGWFSWRAAVIKWLAAQKDPTGYQEQVFSNTILGLPRRPKGEQANGDELKKHVHAAPYMLGSVPAGALMLCAGGDIQHNRIEIRVWGFGRDKQRWLIDRHIVYGSPMFDETWAGVEEILVKAYRHASGSSLRIAALALDASDGNTTHYVRAFARKWALTKRVIAVKGQAQQGKSIIGKPTTQDVNHKGVVIKDGVKLWPYGSDTAKALIYAAYQVEQPGPNYVYLPQGLPDDEFAQMTCETKRIRYVNGYPRYGWYKPAGAANEALDCFGMALAAAIYAGVDRKDWDELERRVAPNQKDMFSAPVQTHAQQPDTETAPPAMISSPVLPPPRSSQTRKNRRVLSSGVR